MLAPTMHASATQQLGSHIDLLLTRGPVQLGALQGAYSGSHPWRLVLRPQM